MGDRYNMSVGYEGQAIEKLQALEAIDAGGDVVTLQDFTNGETLRGVIESMKFVRQSPPERRFNNFGGIIQLQFRVV